MFGAHSAAGHHRLPSVTSVVITISSALDIRIAPFGVPDSRFIV